MSTSQFDPRLACVCGDESLVVGMVFKAKQIGASPVPHLCLAATQSMPEPRQDVDPNEHVRVFRSDAETVVDALYASLPGGTLDQILRLLLERKASQFIVRF